jgi:hypothetical protein
MSNAARIPDFPEMPENADTPDLRSISQYASLLLADRELPRETEDDEVPPGRRSIFYQSFSAVAEACGAVAQNSIAWGRGLGRRVKRVKNEKPLQFLALIAGAAFALGVAARFWRENRER